MAKRRIDAHEVLVEQTDDFIVHHYLLGSFSPQLGPASAYSLQVRGIAAVEVGEGPVKGYAQLALVSHQLPQIVGAPHQPGGETIEGPVPYLGHRHVSAHGY